MQRMRQILSEKYFYKPSIFDGRSRVVSLNNGSSTYEKNVLLLDVCPGVPFMLLVALPSNASKATKKSAYRYALSTDTIGIVSFFALDSGEFEVFRRHFRNDEFEAIQDIEYYYKQTSNDKTSFSERDSDSTNKKDQHNGKRLPITNKLENIFFDIHSTMRDIDGLHADAALEELCKLIYLKFYIEEHESRLPITPVTTESFATIEEYASYLRFIYKEAIDYDLRVFRLKIPEYERSRGVFDLPIFLSSAALVKAFQLIEKYSLTHSDTDLKGRAFQKVLSKSVRSGMGQYFTPVQVCQLMVDIIEPTSSDLILDPFCGSGHFLTQSLAHVRRTTPDHTKEYHEFAFGKLHGIEKSDRMTRIAMTDMRLSGDGHSNIRCTDALLDFRNYPDIKPESFDIIITNPPFGSILGEEAFLSLAKFTLSEGRKKVPLEVVGLERAIEFLRPGGRIGIVLPESIFSAESFKYVRSWLLKQIVPRIIIDLPNETFAPFGANVRSGILFGRKLLPGEKTTADQKVLMIRVDNLGYDASGRPIEGSEVAKAVQAAKQFLREEGW